MPCLEHGRPLCMQLAWYPNSNTHCIGIIGYLLRESFSTSQPRKSSDYDMGLVTIVEDIAMQAGDRGRIRSLLVVFFIPA